MLRRARTPAFTAALAAAFIGPLLGAASPSIAGTASATPAIGVSPASARAAATQKAALANPATSLAPSSAFVQACFTADPDDSACNAAALGDIDRARAGEGLGPLALPSDYSSLGTTAQLVAVANAERTSRGLPALPENAKLDAMAQAGAVAGRDPSGPNGYGWGSNISWGYPTALAADFAWMYDDGPGSDNIGCTSASSSGCWGHRENILSRWSGASGAGVYDNRGDLQLTELFVEKY